MSVNKNYPNVENRFLMNQNTQSDFRLIPGASMIGKALDERSLLALVEAGAVTELVTTRDATGSAYNAAARVGVRLVPIRAQRAPVRAWKSLDGLASFAERVGISRISVEL